MSSRAAPAAPRRPVPPDDRLTTVIPTVFRRPTRLGPRTDRRKSRPPSTIRRRRLRRATRSTRSRPRWTPRRRGPGTNGSAATASSGRTAPAGASGSAGARGPRPKPTLGPADQLEMGPALAVPERGGPDPAADRHLHDGLLHRRRAASRATSAPTRSPRSWPATARKSPKSFHPKATGSMSTSTRCRCMCARR